MPPTSSCPAAAYTEKAGTYVNTEGRVQFADKAVFAPGDAREDWTILRALADALGVSVGFDSFDELRAAMIAEVPALGEEGLADYGTSCRKASKRRLGRDRLSDQGLLPHQPDRPRQRGDAALFGRTAARRRRSRRRRNDRVLPILGHDLRLGVVRRDDLPASC